MVKSVLFSKIRERDLIVELDFEKYKARQFCDKAECSAFGKIGEGNIRTQSRKNQQVYCNQCDNSWVITKGTFFYHLKTPVRVVVEVLMLLAEGMGVNAVCRVKGVTADSMRSWLTKASDHVEEIRVYLQEEMHLTQCQIDEFWSFILKKSQLERRRTLS